MPQIRPPLTRAGALLLAGLLLSCAEGSVVETPLPVADINIAGGRPSLTVGESMQLQATPRSASGQHLTARTVNWSSSNTSVATVNGAGLVQAVGAGNASITATSGPASSSASLQVIEPPRLQLSHTTLAFTGTAGGADPAAATVTVTNSTGPEPIPGVSVTASSTGGWLTAVATPAGTSTPLNIRVEARTSGLPAGQHTGTITVAAPSAANSPRVINVTLTLAAPQFALTVVGSGSGSGVVRGNGIDCTITAGTASGTCVVSLTGGTTAVLTATPNPGSTFGAWTSCTAVVSGNCSVAMTQNRSVTAAFVAAQPPSARTVAATEVGPGSALLRGDVSSATNIAAGYNIWFELGTSPTLATFLAATPFHYQPGDPQCTAVNVDCRWQIRWFLRGSTTYYFRVAASNPAGAARGDILSFTTLAPQPPAVSTDSATLITPSTFRTHGTFVPNGADQEFWFEVSSSPAMATPSVSPSATSTAEEGPTVFSIDWAGAVPNTTYYYRAVSRNSAGIRVGVVRSLTTAAHNPAVPGVNAAVPSGAASQLTGDYVFSAPALRPGAAAAGGTGGR